MTAPVIEPLDYRTAMGHFCTGVTVITAADEEGPVGFACQSFSALSLDPPLILWSIGRDSDRYDIFREYTKLVDDQASELKTLRGLFRLKTGERQRDGRAVSHRGIGTARKTLAAKCRRTWRRNRACWVA